MSGPKLMELRRMRAAAERLRNHDLCAGGLSEYRRLCAEFWEWSGRLSELSVPVKSSLQEEAIFERTISNRLAAEQHHEAARLMREELSAVRGSVLQLKEQFRQRVIELQQRHRQLSVDRMTLQQGRSRLQQYLEENIPPQWPENDKLRLRQMLQTELAKTVDASMPTATSDLNSTHHLESAEKLVSEGLATLSRVTEALKQELEIANRKYFEDKLVEQRIGGPSLASVLQRFKRQQTETQPEHSDGDELERLLGELAGLASPETFNDLNERVLNLASEPNPTQRETFKNALIRDANLRVTELRNLSRQREDIYLLIDSAAHMNDAAVATIVAELRQMLGSRGLEDLNPVRARLQTAVADAEQRREREARRRALVDSLKSLGYETNENLETAFVQAGKLVLRRSDDANYGVEIVADNQLNKVQTAVVRYASSADITEQQRRRDCEREESWCADHARLRAAMKEQGFDIAMKMQLKPGEHPVRVIIQTDKATGRSIDTAVPAVKRTDDTP